MKKVAIIQARMSSSRLPGKVLTQLGHKPVLAWVVDAAKDITGIDEVVVATSIEESDTPIANWCQENDTRCYRGSLEDVLERFVQTAEAHSADIVMRITADCPLLDPQICGTILKLQEHAKCDYASNITPPSWPDGLDCEVFTMEALRKAYQQATNKAHREHVTAYIYQNRHTFKVENLTCPLKKLDKERWTLDTSEDLEFLQQVAKYISSNRPPSYLEVMDIIEENNILRTNNNIERNEGSKPKPEEIEPIKNFKNSTKFLKEAESVIPLGSQTFSKSKVQYPVGHAPLFISHGHGGHVWDIDGNKYIDLVCGLLPVVLGYNDADIDYGIRAQLNNGITFSLASDLETKLAKKLVEIIPCAEMVRFGKNGTDATSASIRLARAYTGRDKVMVCGYHGWQDWYIGSTTRNKGIPESIRDLTVQVPYNNLEKIEELLKTEPESFAAMIMEPMNVVEPEEGYLENLKELLHKYGVLLVFDETITGFRYALGGAQELFGVTPDMATFGKALGNGMPISAIVGKKEIMMEMEEVFFSGTFGGETLSIAAALALIEKMESEPVIKHLWEMGGKLRWGVQKLLKEHDLSATIQLKGKDPWIVLGFNPHGNISTEAIKTMWEKEMIAHGVLTIGSHNICYAHTEADIEQVIHAYSKVLPKIADAIKGGDFNSQLNCEIIQPVFKVR